MEKVQVNNVKEHVFEKKQTVSHKPNVILVVADTVRADHLSCYRYRRRTTPNIDLIAREGILYENAFSTAHWSPPSHASIFTGKYPSYHKTMGKDVFLRKDNVTIAEILQSEGYETIGISSCGVVGTLNGFNRGFQQFFDVYDIPTFSLKSVIRYSEDIILSAIRGSDNYTFRTNQLVKKVISKICSRNGPFFLFVNYFCCHDNHIPPRPFDRMHCDLPAHSKNCMLELCNDFLFKAIGRSLESDNTKIKHCASYEGIYDIITGEIRLSKEEWKVIESWYDGQLSYLDYTIGKLVDFLRDKKIYDNTLLILTSDHGENFGEHGLAGHLFCLYDSLIHVPLIIRYPSLIPKNKRITSLASLTDIFPTILDILDSNKVQDVQGVSLYPFKDREIHEFVCAESGIGITENEIFRKIPQKHKLKKFDKGLKCLRSKDYKYILSSDGKEELYDMRNDPFELTNISQTNHEVLRYLNTNLQSLLDIEYFGSEKFPSSRAQKEHEKILNRMKTLGYIKQE